VNSDCVRRINEANWADVEQQLKKRNLVPSYGLPACRPNVAGSVDPATPSVPTGACADPDAEADDVALADADVETGGDADPDKLAAGDSVVGAVAVPHAAIMSDNITIKLMRVQVFFRCIIPPYMSLKASSNFRRTL